MLFRSEDNKLVVWKQWRDGDVLEKLAQALQTNLGVAMWDIEFTTTFLRRPKMVVRFATEEAADAAEAWVANDNNFDF